MIRILTFNMAHFYGWFKCGNLAKTKEAITDYNVDVGLFQEGVGFFGFDGIKNATPNGFDCQTVRMEKRFWGAWKLGVVTKYSIVHWDEFELGYPDNEWRRSVLGVCLDDNTGNGGIKAVTCHFGHSQHEDQILKTLAFLNSLPVRYPKLEIIGGDFNYKQNGPAWHILADEGFRAVGWDNVDGIWIRTKMDISTIEATTILDGASDVHRGVLVTL